MGEELGDWVDNVDEFVEMMADAVDSGMIYTADQMAVADHFGTLDVGKAFEDAYEDFYNEVYQEVESQVPEDDEDEEDEE